MNCVVDCRIDKSLDNDFLQLSLWGKPCFSYVIESVIKAGCFNQINCITDSARIIEYIKRYYKGIKINSSYDNLSDAIFKITGRAPCISSSTIRKAVEIFDGKKSIISSKSSFVYNYNDDKISFYNGLKQCAYNVFTLSLGRVTDRGYYFYKIPDNEAVVINSANDFELALVLKKKQENRHIVLQIIDRIINEKKTVLKNVKKDRSICLVGHSQIDQWNINDIGGYHVRNCGISGISSFEYYEKILSKDLLDCHSDLFFIMHGTNDIVWDYRIKEIVDSIEKNIEYIRKRNKIAPIIFASCLHVNGRLDRNNTRIDKLNLALKNRLKNRVIWFDTSFFDDKYGNLSEEYTKDGLHINEAGYDMFLSKLESVIKEVNI